MTSATWILLFVAAVLAVADWVAVARARKRLEYFAKPATMVALIGLALTLTPESAPQQLLFVVALAFGALGDVFLMLPRNLFLAGLSAFLVGHIAYVLGFLAAGVPVLLILVIVPVVLLPGAVVLPRLVGGILRQGKRPMVPAVLAYSLVISVMAASALASGSPLAAVGGLLFYVSDTLIGFNRFVTQRPWMPLAIIVTYHVGQALLVLSLAR